MNIGKGVLGHDTFLPRKQEAQMCHKDFCLSPMYNRVCLIPGKKYLGISPTIHVSQQVPQNESDGLYKRDDSWSFQTDHNSTCNGF